MFGGRLSDSDSGEEGPHFTSTVMVMIVMVSLMMVVNMQFEGLYPKDMRTNQDDEYIDHKVFFQANRR